MTLTFHITFLGVCITLASIVYLTAGFLIWKEWNYTFPEMNWSKSRWKWLWFPLYKASEFFIYVFLWPLVAVIGIGWILLWVLTDMVGSKVCSSSKKGA